MKKHSLLATVLAASTVLAGAAYAADQTAAPPAPSAAQPSAAQKTLDTDALKLSSDGAEAFRDMRQVRLAIFNADPDQAKTLIGKAQGALVKAKTDETAFTKAEADLHPPKDAKAPAKTSNAGDSPDAAKPVTWLPIDGQLTLGEDFVATSQKASAVTDANKSLAAGDQKSAMEKLRLAGINVNFTMAVAPLDRTVSDVDQAANLIGQGKYYEANAVLKTVEDGVRFDMIDTTAVPQKAAAAKDAKDAKGPAQSAAPAKSATH